MNDTSRTMKVPDSILRMALSKTDFKQSMNKNANKIKA